jgi:hypothetical protein
MREAVWGVLLFVFSTLVFPKAWESFMTAAPDWVERVVRVVFVVVSVVIVLMADPVYMRLRDSQQHRVASAVIVVLAVALLSGPI